MRAFPACLWICGRIWPDFFPVDVSLCKAAQLTVRTGWISPEVMSLTLFLWRVFDELCAYGYGCQLKEVRLGSRCLFGGLLMCRAGLNWLSP